MRALYRDIIAMAFVEGGSTLTQQLARNLFLEKQKKIERKIKEILMAIEIERKYTKIEILELYLNQVYWGHNAYGIESASQMYFGKKSKDLTLAEAAGLVGMLKGPELFSPFRHFDRFKRRQRVVLKRMEYLDLITAEQVEDAYNEKVALASRKRHRYKAGFFASYVVDQLIEMYGEETLYTSGMKVYTTLNYKLQQHAEHVVKKYRDYGDQVFVLKGERYPSLNYKEALYWLLTHAMAMWLLCKVVLILMNLNLIEPFKLNVNQDRHLNRLFIWPHLRKGFLLEPLFLIPPLHLIPLRGRIRLKIIR